MVILAHLEDEIPQGCAKMEDFKNFVLEEVLVGTPLTLSIPAQRMRICANSKYGKPNDRKNGIAYPIGAGKHQAEINSLID